MFVLSITIAVWIFSNLDSHVVELEYDIWLLTLKNYYWSPEPVLFAIEFFVMRELCLKIFTKFPKIFMLLSLLTLWNFFFAFLRNVFITTQWHETVNADMFFLLQVSSLGTFSS